jgi:uncharacterized protein
MGKHSRMRNAKLASVLVFAVLLGVPGTALAGEPVIPRAAPRPANTAVLLPDQSTVHVELALTDTEHAYGLMERSNLPEGRGMLFVHDQPGQYAYWMYHCRISLDIVWMDVEHRVVEIAADTPPCKGQSSTCPSYGGHEVAKYVLELPSGSAKRHGIATGEVVRFGL